LDDGESADAGALGSSTRLTAPGVRHPRWVHIVSAVWLLVVAVGVLAPVLAHGASFGSFDVLSQFGLLHQSGVAVHNLQAGDQADQIIPWMTLAWTQVHHGQLPLWNPYAALGMPLAFNWQTAAFSVPSLIGYLFPLRLASSVQVIITLVIAGTGVYRLGRVLRLGVLASVFAGTVYELSGPLLGWLGWPHAAVMSWAGWLFAASLLLIRGKHRLRYVTMLALVIAAMIYAGQAEIVLLFGVALLVFVAVLLVQRTSLVGGSGPIRRPVLDLIIAVATGGALSAPLALPGLQVISGSQHSVPGGDPGELVPGNPALPAHNLTHFIFQGFDGLPVAGSHWFGYAGGYSETAAYVGVIALVLAVMAVGVRHRHPVVVAFGGLIAAMGAIAFIPVVVSSLYRLPLVGTVLWQRAIMPLSFGIAVLAGVGMDVLVRSPNRQAVRRWIGGGFAVSAALLVGLWVFGRGHLPADEATIRARSFVWPVIETAVGLAVAGGLVLVSRRSNDRAGRNGRSSLLAGRVAGVSLFICETAFLVASGAQLWTSTSTPFATTPSVVALKGAVGSSVVGLGAPLCFLPPGLGIPENAQLAYGVQELALYDPMTPSAYFSSWKALTHQSAGNPNDSVFCPGINTVALARLYGVSFVLEPAGTPGPLGAEFEQRIGNEDLFRIPNSGVATLTPLTANGELPAADALGTPVPVTHPNPASWALNTDTVGPSVLRLRLIDVPGWHATIDGRAVPLRRFAGVMIEMDVPPGRHTIELHYWPATFTAGIIIALCALIGLATAWLVGRVRRRRTAAAPGSSSRPATDVSIVSSSP
jgi:Bacterial membrane protein YfhO